MLVFVCVYAFVLFFIANGYALLFSYNIVINCILWYRPNTKTSPALRTLLRYKLSKWLKLDHGPPPRIYNDKLGRLLSGALEEQHDIGWDNFMKGRLSYKWGEAQQYFYNKFYPSSGYNRERWMHKTITAVWQIFMLIWKARNAHLHDAIDNDESTHLNLRIKHAYGKLRHSVAQSDKLLFTMTLKDRLDSSVYAKLAWLEAVRIAEHDYTVVNNRQPTQRTITEFFTTNDPTAALETINGTQLGATTWENSNDWDGPDLI